MLRKVWKASRVPNRDFEAVIKFSETLQASRRFELPLEGVLVIGYLAGSPDMHFMCAASSAGPLEGLRRVPIAVADCLLLFCWG